MCQEPLGKQQSERSEGPVPQRVRRAFLSRFELIVCVLVGGPYAGHVGAASPPPVKRRTEKCVKRRKVGKYFRLRCTV